LEVLDDAAELTLGGGVASALASELGGGVGGGTGDDGPDSTFCQPLLELLGVFLIELIFVVPLLSGEA
jgi:hypothetical protein